MESNPFTLAGKTILITGASSGIGRQIAVSCAAAGANLVVTGRDQGRLEQLLMELGDPRHCSIAADLASDSGISEVTKRAGKLNGVVHSAGISALAPMRLVSRAHIESQLNINLVAPMLLTAQLLARNRIEANGSILIISSISVYVGVRGVAAYSASKAAVEAMTRSLSIEVAKKGIRANCLAPGSVETPMLQAARETTGGMEDTLARYPLGFGKPEDIANAAIFFLSDASRWITGATLLMDGGYSVG